ncbi:MAG: PhzF family phenazine biosynthesis protein [Sulfuricellaceae bacterium]|nr:PhzF family phenazine biosynthesis protein [Sulfuricellaceae bacterium]
MRIPMYQIDAFADRLFVGNPAAVCVLEQWLGDDLLQAIAAENNLSETAFLVPSGEGYALRWFTPLAEVDLCGHATLAAAFVVFHFLRPESNEVAFATRSGVLRVCREGDWLRMDFPAWPPEACATPDALLRGLGSSPVATFRAPQYYLARYESESAVRALTPDMELLMQLDLMAVIVTAPGTGEADFISRVFAPKVGVREDPVTGSAHSVLTPYWALQLKKTRMRAHQLSRRGGVLDCVLQGDRVEIAGQAKLFFSGEIVLPA